MKIEFRPTKITVDSGKLIPLIRPYLELAASKVEDKYLELMGQGIDETSTAPQGWRDSIKADLKHIDSIVTNTVVEYICGLDYQQETSAWMRAMVIAYGMGKLGLNGNKIMAGPLNRTVWNWDLTHPIPSNVKNEHEIPQSWYHAGGRFLQNSTMIMGTLFKDIAEDALSAIPKNIIRTCITVQVR
jgi:hypothetical protein